MTNHAGSRLRRAIKDAAEQFTRSRTAKAADALGEIQNSVYPLLQMLADKHAEQEQAVTEIAGAVDEHEKAIEDLYENDGSVDVGIETELADRLLVHLAAFAGILEQSKAVWATPESEMPPQMLAGKATALASIAKMETENSALVALVKEARLEPEDAPVVSIVPNPKPDDDEPDDDNEPEEPEENPNAG